MGNKDLKEEILDTFLIAMDEKLDKRNTLSKDQIDNEKGEFKRAGLSRAEAKKGRGITLKNLKGVGNTDAEDFDADTPHGKMRQWARTMQTNKTDKKKGKESKKAGRVIPSKEDRKKSRDQRRAVHTQVQSDTDAPSIISTQGKGKDKKRDVLAGNTRISLRRALGKPLKAHIFKSSKPAPRAYEQKRGITGEEAIHIRNAVLNYLEEGSSFGNSPTQTGARVGRAMTKMYSEDPSQEKIQAKRAQAKRIRSKVGNRQVQNRKKVGGMLNKEGSHDTRPYAHQVDKASQDRFTGSYSKHRESFVEHIKKAVLNYLSERRNADLSTK